MSLTHIWAETLLLQLERVEGGYGRARALHGIDLVVQKGEAVALIGSNGAGKSTILRAISGLNAISSGSIRFEGIEIGKEEPRRIVRLGIAHCPEERKIWPNLSVLEHLELGATVLGRLQASDLEQIYSLFPILSERRHQAAGTLSGGQQQMVAIARALLLQPDLLIMDEPSTGLAPKVVKDILHVIKDLRGRGIALLLVEQNVGIAADITDRAYVLTLGRIAHEIKIGDWGTFLADDRLVKAYLGS